MRERSDDHLGDAPSLSRQEITRKATPVSRGVGFGTIQILHGLDRQFFKREIDESAVAAEIERFRDALALSRQQLDRAIANGGTSQIKEILSVQQMMLADVTLQRDVENAITAGRLNAEWATVSIIATFAAKLRSLSDDGLRDRHIDVEDVGERLLSALLGNAPQFEPVYAETVIAASELRPSTLAAFADSGIRGIVTEHGGWTSHAFILARELGIPAVTGVRDLVRRVRAGDLAIVDGEKGNIILNPSPGSIQRFDIGSRSTDMPAARSQPESRELETRDGRRILLKANIDIISYYPEAQRLGARGIGLYRSEFLFNRFKGLPGEEEQLTAYRELADMVGRDGAVVRTFDVGLRQFVQDLPYRERNPALGLKAIRLSLTRPDEFRVQLRSIMRAASGGNLKISLPMVSGVGEIRAAREILREEHASLEKDGKKHALPPLGIMIEVPSTILIIEEIVEESDFICLGTNDLVQYMLAVDRDNELVAGWFNTLHPSVVRAIKKVVDTCARAGRQLVVCGEMAGSRYYAPVLIGLGARELSTNVSAIGRVRDIVAGITFEEAQRLAEKITEASTSEEADSILNQHIQEFWPGLYPPKSAS